MVIIGMSGFFLAGSVSEKRVFLVQDLIVIKGIHLKHNSNDLARNIASIFLQLHREIFIHKKRNQVEAD